MNTQAIAVLVFLRFWFSCESYSKGRLEAWLWDFRIAFNTEPCKSIFKYSIRDRGLMFADVALSMSRLEVAVLTFESDLQSAARDAYGKSMGKLDFLEVTSLLEVFINQFGDSLGDDEEFIARAVFSTIACNQINQLYDGLGGNFSELTVTSKNVAAVWSGLFTQLNSSLSKLRLSLGGAPIGYTVEGRSTDSSMVYHLVLEEIENDGSFPLQTFAQVFQEFLSDYSQQQEWQGVLCNGNVAIKAALQNEGVEEWRKYRFGGPIQYMHLRSLITI